MSQEQIYEDIERGIAYVLSIVRGQIPDQDQGDILQDIRLALITALPKFNGKAKIKTYIHSIVNKKIADYYRSKYKQAKILKKLMEITEYEKKYKEEIKRAIRIKKITPRQREVFELIGKGYQNKEISEKLFISINTVRSHVKGINQIFNPSNRSRLVVLANKINGEKL